MAEEIPGYVWKGPERRVVEASDADEKTGVTIGGKTLKKGDLLFKAGETLDAAFKVEDGEIGLMRDDKIVARFGKGCFVGGAAVMLEKPQMYTAVGLGVPMTFLSQYDGRQVRNTFSTNSTFIELLAVGLDTERAALELAEVEASEQTLGIKKARTFARERADRIAALLGQ